MTDLLKTLVDAGLTELHQDKQEREARHRREIKRHRRLFQLLLPPALWSALNIEPESADVNLTDRSEPDVRARGEISINIDGTDEPLVVTVTMRAVSNRHTNEVVAAFRKNNGYDATWTASLKSIIPDDEVDNWKPFAADVAHNRDAVASVLAHAVEFIRTYRQQGAEELYRQRLKEIRTAIRCAGDLADIERLRMRLETADWMTADDYEDSLLLLEASRSTIEDEAEQRRQKLEKRTALAGELIAHAKEWVDRRRAYDQACERAATAAMEQLTDAYPWTAEVVRYVPDGPVLHEIMRQRGWDGYLGDLVEQVYVTRWTVDGYLTVINRSGTTKQVYAPSIWDVTQETMHAPPIDRAADYHVSHRIGRYYVNVPPAYAAEVDYRPPEIDAEDPGQWLEYISRRMDIYTSPVSDWIMHDQYDSGFDAGTLAVSEPAALADR